MRVNRKSRVGFSLVSISRFEHVAFRLNTQFVGFYCLNFDNCLTEVVSDVMSGIAVQEVGVDARVNFGDSRSNRFGAMHVFTDGQADRPIPFS